MVVTIYYVSDLLEQLYNKSDNLNKVCTSCFKLKSCWRLVCRLTTRSKIFASSSTRVKTNKLWQTCQQFVTNLFASCWQVVFALLVPSCWKKFETSCSQLVTILVGLLDDKTDVMIKQHRLVLSTLWQSCYDRVVRTTLWKFWYFRQACYNLSAVRIQLGDVLLTWYKMWDFNIWNPVLLL